MNEQESLNFSRIAAAIEYIKTNFKEQPTLDELAEKINLSPFHFQRLFKEWAGVTPKKFLQYTSVEYAKSRLKSPVTLFEATQETGLSSTGRLHDLFIKLEGMTPGEFKNGGANLSIKYRFSASPFGTILVASTEKGVCYMAFSAADDSALEVLKSHFPKARFRQESDAMQQAALAIFHQDWSQPKTVKLHLKGTDFQLKVWEMLLKIPFGKVSTYGAIATQIQNPKASRAVGTAIGSNPVAFLIPCHRVIQASGNLGGYRWGTTRKTAVIAWEASKLEP
jgi:AraC family transcriptional regulator, regulatory protein of adaptative response / methylated-DNA-[protein]-cysteine methyltransferase